MCGSNANVPPQVNTAKCWSIPVMVFAIISCMGLPVGLVVWPCLISGVGGIVALVGSSILICCGPSDASAGAGKMMAGFILMLIGAICELGGAIAGLIFNVWLAMVAYRKLPEPAGDAPAAVANETAKALGQSVEVQTEEAPAEEEPGEEAAPAQAEGCTEGGC